MEIDKTWHAELPIHWILETAKHGGIVPPGTELTDHAQVLDALLGEPAALDMAAPFREFQHKRRDMLNDRSAASGAMWPGDIIQALAAALPPETIVTTDVGSHKYLFGQFWPSRQPRNVLDVQRTLRDGVWIERCDRRQARAPRSASARGRG